MKQPEDGCANLKPQRGVIGGDVLFPFLGFSLGYIDCMGTVFLNDFSPAQAT